MGRMLTTATSASLLDALKQPGNQTAWQAYVDRYRPIIAGYLARTGLRPEDVEDVAQEALFEFSKAYRGGGYDPSRGRLRSWLFGIVRNAMASWRRRRAREQAAGAAVDASSAILSAIPDRADKDEAWEREWQDAVLRQCLEEVRREVEPKTYEAFELFALGDVPASDVATRLGMTQNAVFGCKRRIMDRVRELIPLMDGIL